MDLQLLTARNSGLAQLHNEAFALSSRHQLIFRVKLDISLGPSQF